MTRVEKAPAKINLQLSVGPRRADGYHELASVMQTVDVCDTLTVTAHKSVEKKDGEQNGKMLRQERYAGSMSRSFYVGSHVTEDDVKARYEDGVLRLTLPKKDAKQVEQKKTILIEG